MYEQHTSTAQRVGWEFVELYLDLFESGSHPGSVMAGMLIAVAFIAREYGIGAELAKVLHELASGLEKESDGKLN